MHRLPCLRIPFSVTIVTSYLSAIWCLNHTNNMFSEHLWLSLSTDSMIPSVLATTRFLPKISFHLLTNMQEMLPHLKRTNEVKWTQSQRVIKVQGSALVTTHHVAPHGVDLIPSATRVAAATCSSDKNKYQICSLICSIWIHPKRFFGKWVPDRWTFKAESVSTKSISSRAEACKLVCNLIKCQNS